MWREVETAAYRAMPEVGRLIGNAEKLNPSAWAGAAEGPGVVMTRGRPNPPALPGWRGIRAPSFPCRTACDHRCTFCVIPFGRGEFASVPAGAVVEQVARTVEAGGHEVVLTGVDLTAYGRDLREGLSLGGLVLRILAEVPGLARLRLSSIDSVEVDEALFRAIAEERRLMPHLHLSLQAGGRSHSQADEAPPLPFGGDPVLRDGRAARPGLVFGADLIAGFPRRRRITSPAPSLSSRNAN